MGVIKDGDEDEDEGRDVGVAGDLDEGEDGDGGACVFDDGDEGEGWDGDAGVVEEKPWLGTGTKMGTSYKLKERGEMRRGGEQSQEQKGRGRENFSQPSREQ